MIWSIYDFVIKDWNLQVFYKKLEIFIFIFFNFNSSCAQNTFCWNIPIDRGFPTMPNLLNHFNSWKSYFGPKN